MQSKMGFCYAHPPCPAASAAQADGAARLLTLRLVTGGEGEGWARPSLMVGHAGARYQRAHQDRI